MVCGVVLGFMVNGFAEPYKSKEFPPYEVLKTHIVKIEKNFKGVIGKKTINEKSYEIYYAALSGVISKITLEKLDNDIWILQGSFGFGMLQK